ncbi:MAG: PASTA domain-containing protein [Crocinitomicaceae bacterium]|jgi:beta-lactam-binding protein with PASTA domain
MSRFSNIKEFIKTKHFVKQIGLIILTYLIIVGGTLLYLDIRTHHGEKIAVPNLIGKHSDNIEELLDDSGLDYIIIDSIYRPELPAGTIVKQIPEATSRTKVFVKSSRILEISLSKKIRYVVIPDLMHKSKRYAESILKNRGLKFRLKYTISPNDIDAVVSQRYNGRKAVEGLKVPFGSVIDLIVGKASKDEPFEVPDLYGLTLAQADSATIDLPSVSLIIGECIGCKTKRDSLSARVTGQTPEYFEGNTRPPGSDIVIFLDKNFKDNREAKEEDEE